MGWRVIDVCQLPPPVPPRDPNTIRIFVGAAAKGEDAESQAVLEWTARKHASRPVEIVWMQQTTLPSSPWGGWATERWATPFSGFRWAVPEVCNFEGRAIYCDSDVWFQADPAELLDQPFPDRAVVLAKPASWRLCVSVWDCAAARGVLPSLAEMKAFSGAHNALTMKFRHPSPLLGAFSGNWNCLDGEKYASLDDPDIKAVHYTDMRMQPQLRHALPRLRAEGKAHWFDGQVMPHKRKDIEERFDALLAEAIEAGYSPGKYAHAVPSPPSGPYRKLSMKGYLGARP